MTWWRIGKSTRVRCPSEAGGGATTAAACRPRLEEEGLMKPPPIAEPGKQQRNDAAAAMRAVSVLRGRWRWRRCALVWGCLRSWGRLGYGFRSVERCETDRWG